MQRAMTSQYEELKHLKKSREQDQCSHADRIQNLQKQIEANKDDLENYQNLQNDHKVQ